MKLEGLEHPKVLDLCARLKISRPQAIGHLELLWAYTAKLTPQGNIGKWPDGTIARACDWTGDAETFVLALINARLLDRHLDHRLVVHDWHEHAPAWVRAKLQKTKQSFVSILEQNNERDLDADLEGSQERSSRARVLPSLAKPNQDLVSLSRAREDEREIDEHEDEGNKQQQPERKITPEAAMAIPLREAGVKVTAIHPTLVAWVQDGYTLQQLQGALAIAREAKGEDVPIHAKYLDTVLRDPKNWPAINRAKPNGSNGKHAPPKRSVDEAEDEIIIRAIREGLTDEQIVEIEDLAIAPNLPQRIRAKRQELQREQH